MRRNANYLKAEWMKSIDLSRKIKDLTSRSKVNGEVNYLIQDLRFR